MTTLITKSPAYAAARTKLGDHRHVFESVVDALTTLREIYKLPNFPQDFPVVGARIGLIDVTGEDEIPPLKDWPAEYSAPGVKVCVTFVGVRGLKDENDKETNGARGFAVYPLHPLDAIQNDDSGINWLWKVAEKEASHVALRKLRNVNIALGIDAFAQAAMEMPITVSDYVEETTREGLDTSAFDSIWVQFRKMLKTSPATAALDAELPTKPDVIKAIRSKAFALENYERLEKMSATGAFVFIAETMAAVIDRMRANAIEKGEDFELDSDEIRAWVKERDTKVFPSAQRVAADLSTVDFAAFGSQLGVGGETE